MNNTHIDNLLSMPGSLIAGENKKTTGSAVSSGPLLNLFTQNALQVRDHQ